MPNAIPIPLHFVQASAKYAASTFKVYFFLVAQMFEKETFPEVSVSQQILADRSELSSRSVHLAVRALEADGHIVRASKDFHATTYRVLGFDETGLAQHAEGTDGLEFPTVEVHEDSANCKSVEEPDETSLSSPAVDTEIAYTEKDEIDRIVANLSLNDDDVQALIAAAGGKERLRFCLQDLHLSGGIDPAAPTANGMLFSFVSCRCRGYDAAPPYHS